MLSVVCHCFFFVLCMFACCFCMFCMLVCVFVISVFVVVVVVVVVVVIVVVVVVFVFVLFFFGTRFLFLCFVYYLSPKYILNLKHVVIIMFCYILLKYETVISEYSITRTPVYLTPASRHSRYALLVTVANIFPRALLRTRGLYHKANIMQYITTLSNSNENNLLFVAEMFPLLRRLVR